MDTKILIVEDEVGLATTLRDRLRKEGYLVTVARDGISGLDLATHEQFELMILDLMLPGEGGLTVCEKVRQSRSNVPILMLTALRQTADKVTARNQPASYTGHSGDVRSTAGVQVSLWQLE